MHEIFDYHGGVIPGKFKLPLYSRDLDPNHLFTGSLPYFGNSCLYIRINLPWDPYLDNDTHIFMEEEYHVPPIHLQGMNFLKNNDYIYIQQREHYLDGKRRKMMIDDI